MVLNSRYDFPMGVGGGLYPNRVDCKDAMVEK